MTRRTAIGAGLSVAAVAYIGGSLAAGSGRPRQHGRSIDALLVDESIELPRQMATFFTESRRALPVLGVRLDAASQGELMHVLDNSRAVVGVSSGATLFCLERIAWDHGYRLTARRQHPSDVAAQACLQDTAMLLSGAGLEKTGFSLSDRSYRPTRADGQLHVWLMEKSSPSLRQHRQEV